MLARDVDDALEDLAGVHRARGVVRVDDDDRLRPIRHLRPDVLQVRRPVLLLVAEVVHRLAAGQRRRRRPQRVVGGRDEDLVALVEQRLRHDRNQLRDAVAQPHVVDVEAGEGRVHLVARDDGAPGRVDALRLRVALRMRQRTHHVLHDRVGRVEAELRGVAGVEHHDAMPVGLHLFRQRRHRAADVVEDVLQLVRLVERAQRRAARVVHAAALGDAGRAGLFRAGGALQLGGLAQRLFFHHGRVGHRRVGAGVVDGGVGGGVGGSGVRSGGLGGGSVGSVGGCGCGCVGGGRVGRGIDGVRVARLVLGSLLDTHP